MANANPQTQSLYEKWNNESEPSKKEDFFNQLVEVGAFPGKEIYDIDGGLYPDLDDKNFLKKLLNKQEFLECKQETIKETQDKGVDKCRSTEDFEITPVQRFVSRLLSPHTPYRSALLFHGVGVGKTCAAITVAESYLKEYPGKKIYIVAPPNIQEGFRRTIFDLEGLSVATKSTSANHRGCTGNIYLELTNSMKEINKDVVYNRVKKVIDSRYRFFGYTSFYNHIMNLVKNIPKGMSVDKMELQKITIFRSEFSNRMIIIDEAHNLRDNPLEGDDDAVDDANPVDTSESKAGKKLTPYLQDVLDVAEGSTLLLMTATPMYNSFVEIVFLLNLLLKNDKFKRLPPEEVFEGGRQGFTGAFRPGGRELLGKIASQYISFMRGENPLTFPIRLKPNAKTRVISWPIISPKGESLKEDSDRIKCLELPCVQGYFKKVVEDIYREQTSKYVRSPDGLGITNMDLLIQAGNWIFPGSSDVPGEEDFLDRIRQQGFENTFTKERKGNLVYFRNTNEGRGASWLLEDQLSGASGKCNILLKRINACRGVAFVYSRFVASGALTIVLALEANGYSCWNRDIGFLAEGNQHPQGRQCALCPRHENGHGSVPEENGTAAHTFKPAKYVLLTGSEELSPNNAGSINAARSAKNIYGEEVKVVVGSQIAGEGLDLRYIREVFVFDSWYHLNKLEQVVGRGIRNCSHAALPKEKKNCTVTLLVNAYANKRDLETIDMYSYRQALKKAIIMGSVTRVLKEYAMDCTLNKGAIQIKNLDAQPMIYDSQGEKRLNQPINDVGLTPMCDWLEKCEYDCRAGDGQVIDIKTFENNPDTSTYDEYTARFQMIKLRNSLREKIAEGFPFIKLDSIQEDEKFHSIPPPLLRTLLNEIVEQKESFTNNKGERGYIIRKNEYYVFQPEKLRNISIPISLRMSHVPVPRDRFKPIDIVDKTIKEKRNEQETVDDSEELWEQSVKWVKTMDDSIPQELMEEIGKLQSSAGGLINTQRERLEMVLWVYDSIKMRGPEDRSRFAEIVLEYIWDEYLTVGTKKHLLSTKWNDPLIRKVAADAYWELEGVLYLRVVNDFTNTIEYISIENNIATILTNKDNRAIIDEIEKHRVDDPLLKYAINTKHTGFEYGFIIFKDKKRSFVFKTGKPPLPNRKISRGSECAIDSGTSYQINLLKQYGDKLKNGNHSDLGLNEVRMSTKRITNSVRICTVSNLALRYMNNVRLEGKRWFYRPLEAKLHNHPLR